MTLVELIEELQRIAGEMRDSGKDPASCQVVTLGDDGDDGLEVLDTVDREKIYIV